MSYWNLDPIEDGDTLGEENWVTDIVDPALAVINGELDGANFQHRAFSERHVGSLIGQRPVQGEYVVILDHGNHVYEQANATFGAALVAYASPASFGGGDGAGAIATADRVVIGNPAVTGSFVGNGGAAARLEWAPGLLLGMDNGDRVGSIELGLNIEVRDFDIVNETTFVVMTCFQFQLNSGTWYTIDRSERFTGLQDMRESDEPVLYDIPLRCFLRAEDVDDHGDSATDRVTGVRAMIAIVNGAASQSITLGRGTFSGLPYHTEVVDP